MSNKTSNRGRGPKKGQSPKDPAIRQFRLLATRELETQYPRHLTKFHFQYREMWELYCKSRNISYDDFKQSKELQTTAASYLNDLKSYNKKKNQNKQAKSTNVKVDNCIVYEVKKTEREKLTPELVKRVLRDGQNEKRKRERTREKNKDIATVDTDEFVEEAVETGNEIEVLRKSKTIERKKISEISFASDITVETVKRIQELSRFKRYFCEDYLYFLAGGKEEFTKGEDGKERVRFKNQLNHIEVSNQMREELKDIANKIKEHVSSDDPNSINELRKLSQKMKSINEIIEATKEMDLAPIKFINAIEDGEFSAQKVLQGTLVNDRAMIDNGNIVLEEKKKEAVLTKEDLDDDLKKLGSSILTGHVESLSDDS